MASRAVVTNFEGRNTEFTVYSGGTGIRGLDFDSVATVCEFLSHGPNDLVCVEHGPAVSYRELMTARAVIITVQGNSPAVDPGKLNHD
jgi:hypothetical protein